MDDRSDRLLLHWSVQLTTDQLAQLPVEIDLFWQAAGMSDATLSHALLCALMEIAENIAHHAYAIPTPQDWLRVDFSLFVDRIEILFADGGQAFDPSHLEIRSLSRLWFSAERGGWGLSLAQRAADDLSYAREDGVNVWKIVAMIDP